MIIRVEHKNNYTVISNSPLQNSNLSFKAKGLIAFLLSQSDNWEITTAGLAKIGPNAKTSIETALAELEEEGYLKKDVQRNDDGTIKKHKKILVENPDVQNPDVENPDVQNPDVDNDQQQSTKDKQSTKGKQNTIKHRKWKKVWNQNIPDEISPITKMLPKRKKKVRLRKQEGIIEDTEELRRVISHIKNSRFLKGENDRNWKVSFDWVIRNSNNAVKILEGKYDDNESKVY